MVVYALSDFTHGASSYQTHSRNFHFGDSGALCEQNVPAYGGGTKLGKMGSTVASGHSSAMQQVIDVSASFGSFNKANNNFTKGCAARGYTEQIANPSLNGTTITGGTWFMH